MFNTPCITATNERCSELQEKGEILAKSCLQEFPCRAFAKWPGLGVWTRAGLTHTACCSWLIPPRSNNTLSHHSHRQGNCGTYRVNTWLQIHCASRKEEEEEEEELHWSKSCFPWNQCNHCWNNTGQMHRCQQRVWKKLGFSHFLICLSSTTSSSLKYLILGSLTKMRYKHGWECYPYGYFTSEMSPLPCTTALHSAGMRLPFWKVP